MESWRPQHLMVSYQERAASCKKYTEPVSWPLSLKKEDTGDSVETQHLEHQIGISFPRGENMGESWKLKDFHIIEEPETVLGPKPDGGQGNWESAPLDSRHYHQEKGGRKLKGTKLKAGFIRDIFINAQKLYH